MHEGSIKVQFDTFKNQATDSSFKYVDFKTSPRNNDGGEALGPCVFKSAPIDLAWHDSHTNRCLSRDCADLRKLHDPRSNRLLGGARAKFTSFWVINSVLCDELLRNFASAKLTRIATCSERVIVIFSFHSLVE